MGMEKQNKKEMIQQYKKQTAVGGVYSLTNTATGRKHVFSCPDLRGMENRFAFMKLTNSCVQLSLQEEWRQYGAQAFRFEVLETLEQKEAQTAKEFREDLQTLESLWLEKA